MKLRPMSDLHLAHHADGGRSMIASLNPLSEDEVLVLAGDIMDSGAKGDRFKHLRSLFAKWKQVIYVLGNHEYYGSAPFKTHRSLAFALADCPNVTVLRNSSTVIDGVAIYGGTLWFPPDPFAWEFENCLADFELIQGFKPWVYDQHITFKAEFHKANPAVVVSHHLPTWKSVHPRFMSGFAANLNRFFVGDVHQKILEKQPKLWIHGHSHESSDYEVGSTRVICNPFGYPMEPKGQFREDLVIEV